jgi:hypothetical protein
VGYAEDLVAIATLRGLGVENVSLFCSSSARIPTGDGPYTVIVETGGLDPERTHNSVAVPAYLRPSAELITHARAEPVAKATARALQLALGGVRNYLVSGGRYYREITAEGDLHDLGQDDAKRHQYGFNLRAVKRP